MNNIWQRKTCWSFTQVALSNTMKTLPRSLITMLFFLKAAVAYSQGSYTVHHYTNKNGLPANGIQGIELDKQTGFLWVGTQGGLVRFDGAYFKNFSSEKKAAMSRTAFIGRNREGTIFCKDDNFKVYRISGNKQEFVMTDTVFYPFYQSKRWQAIFKSVHQIKERLKRHKRSAFLPEWAVFHDESGDSSNFSFLHFGHVYHYSANEDSLYYFSGYTDVLKLGKDVYFVDSSLNLWWYNKRLNKPQQVDIKGLPVWKKKGEALPRFIWKHGMETPLLIWNQNIWKLQGQGNVLQLFPLCHSCSPRNADINFAQVWEERGIIFLASTINGLYVVKAPFLRSIRSDTTTEAGVAEYAQAELREGIVTTGSGLTFSKEGKILPRKNGVSLNVHTVYRDQYGDHWSNAGDTIIHFHTKEGRYTRIAVNDQAERMVFTEVGNRLFVFSDIAIAEITGEQYRLLYKIPYAPNEMKNWLNPDAVVELKPGVLAIASEKLLLFDIEKRTAPDTIPIPDLTVKVRGLLKYGDYLLIGTYGQGFYIYKDGVVKKMPLDKYKYLSHAHCFMPDSNGYCWISTNQGLFKTSMNALIKAYESDLDEIYYHYFGNNDGIFNTEFNGGCQPCALKLSNGLFSFPTMNGVVIMDPVMQHPPPPEGQIFIDEIRVGSVPYQPNDSYLQSLPYGFRDLRFRLAIPQFGNPENIYFSYKLEPYSDDWEAQDILQNNTIRFGGLKPGSYKLYLRVRNGFEPHQFGMTTVEFRILEPWYQTWWFYLLVALGFTALIWGLVKWRTARIAKRKEVLQQLVALQTKNIEAQSRQLESQLERLQDQQVRLEEDNKIKARLIGIISHDMISPLKFIGYMSKNLKDAFPSSDTNYHTASFITNVVQELESLSVNILSWIKFHHGSVKMRPEKFSLYELVAESVEIPSTLATEKGIKFHIDVPEHIEVFQYRKAIGVIVYNLAMNAVKYTAAGEIKINSQYTDNVLSLSVVDTGTGMLPDLVEKLNTEETFVAGYSIGETSKYQFGYVIIKDLLRLADGIMKVESTLNKGTTVTIRFGMPEGKIVAHGNSDFSK